MNFSSEMVIGCLQHISTIKDMIHSDPFLTGLSNQPSASVTVILYIDDRNDNVSVECMLRAFPGAFSPMPS